MELLCVFAMPSVNQCDVKMTYKITKSYSGFVFYIDHLKHAKATGVPW